MLKCVYPTQAAKLGIIAATYRSGTESIFGTCPSSCSLLPLPSRYHGAQEIDHTYLDAELSAVPRRGVAWSYTHFHPDRLYIDFQDTSKSTLNVSTDDYETAVAFAAQRIPTVFAAPATDTQWPRRIHNIRFVRCPAEEHKHVTCQSCGGGRPLCARTERDYVVVFVAHGTNKQAVGKNTGGCYAATGNCLIQWQSTRKGLGPTTWNESNDPERLIAWTAALPIGTLLRHRISGDIGIEKPSCKVPTTTT